MFSPSAPPETSGNFHLLGQVPFDDFLRLQRRLVYQHGFVESSRATVLLCEHESILTVGRKGSREHIRLPQDRLWDPEDHPQQASGRVRCKWVQRGGGAILHGPGQLVICPIVSLAAFSWTWQQYAERFQQALVATLQELNIQPIRQDRQLALWGNTGLLAAFGLGKSDGVTSYGAYLNVCVDQDLYRFIDTDSSGTNRSTMTSVLAERRRPVRMSQVRTLIVEHLASALELDQVHLHTGHPWLETTLRNSA